LRYPEVIVSANILPLLVELTTTGQTYTRSNRGLESEAQVQETLAGKAGQAVTTEAELKAIFKSDTPFSTLTTKRFIRFVDTNDGPNTICPIAFLDGDFSGGHPYLRIQLVIVTHSSQPGNAAQCLVMRFETPEGNDPASQGKHGYYHSQLCTELRLDRSTAGFSIPQCISWSAVSCPAWPIDASTPLQLLACVVFALYGKVDGMRTLRNAYGKDLDGLMAEMHFVFPSPLSKFDRASKRVRRTKAKKKRKSKA
jgi:hypothetical protein